jgi:hypothetical protein
MPGRESIKFLFFSRGSDEETGAPLLAFSIEFGVVLSIDLGIPLLLLLLGLPISADRLEVLITFRLGLADCCCESLLLAELSELGIIWLYNYAESKTRDKKF